MDFPDPWEKADLLGYPTKQALAESEAKEESVTRFWEEPTKCIRDGEMKCVRYGNCTGCPEFATTSINSKELRTDKS